MTQRALETTKPLTVWLDAVPNPDFGETAPKAPPIAGEVPDIAAAQRVVEKYIARFDLGGGNFPMALVKRGDRLIGRISYNGRYWPC